MPCPISTFPGETVTCPSGEKRIHDDSIGFAARLTGNLGAEGEGACSVIGLAISAAARKHRPHHAVVRTASAKVAVERGPHIRAR